MKAGNIFLLLITSLFTVIGLAFNKLYDKYVKKNVVVQFALYSVWTLLVLRLLWWVAKPFCKGTLLWFKSLFAHVHITFTAEPSISMSIIMFVFLGVVLCMVKNAIKDLSE